MSWRQTTLDEHVDIISGPAFKSAEFTEKPDDIPLIKGENVAQGYIAWEKSRYWPRADFENYDRFVLSPGDIVLAMDRPWIPAGLKWAQIQEHHPTSLLVQRVARIRAKGDLQQKFLKYVISSREFTDYIKNIMNGVNVPHISGKQIKSYQFLLPDRKSQEKIGTTLTAYDELIENNRRRIELLERAARELYREWFVRLRFPGHEHTKITDGLPEGWRKETLGTAAPLKYGKALKAENRIDGSYPVYGSSGIVGTHNEPLVSGPGIIVGRKGNVGSIHWSSEAFFPIDTVYFVDSEKVSVFLFYVLQNVTFINTDVAVPGLNRTYAHSREVLIPSDKFKTAFLETVEPLHRQMDVLRKQNGKLSEARDLLLPRLMNGTISV